jgi:hypothetical protein
VRSPSSPFYAAFLEAKRKLGANHPEILVWERCLKRAEMVEKNRKRKR